MTSESDFVWTEHAEDTLKLRYAGGVSYSAIGEEIGCSRSAVAGKVCRLGLSAKLTPEEIEQRHEQAILRRAAKEERRAQKALRRSEKRRRRSDRTGVVLSFSRPNEAARRVPAHVVDPGNQFHCSIVDLTQEKCSYVIGEPIALTYCGAKREHGAFCGFHSFVCYSGVVTGLDRMVAA